MIVFSEDVKKSLINLASEKNVFLEGNITKLIDAESDEKFKNYIEDCISKDKETRKKRLDITKTIQSQNKELVEWKANNEKLNNDLKLALENSEKAKQVAENDLDLLQKKTQNELVGSIVKVALYIICSVGLITSALFAVTLFTDIENKIVESSWSNMFSIMLTNSFSIVGTIMGVKYASDKKNLSTQVCKLKS